MLEIMIQTFLSETKRTHESKKILLNNEVWIVLRYDSVFIQCTKTNQYSIHVKYFLKFNMSNYMDKHCTIGSMKFP